MIKKRIVPIVAISGVVAGISFMLSDLFNLNIEASPGASALNFKLWAGVCLIMMCLGFFWIRKKIYKR